MNRVLSILILLLTAATTAVIIGDPAPPDAQTEPITSLVRLLPAGAETNACSLTRAEEEAATDAFDEMLPVILHPRCFNCHGGVQPFSPDGGHMGGSFRFRGDVDNRAPCQDCHSGLPGWDVAGSGFAFTEKDGRDLCVLFKFTQATGAEFVRHIENDKGGTMFTATAFKGDRALNTAGEVSYEENTGVPPTAEPPPGTHQEFTDLARAWVRKMGRAWTVPGDCGCKIRGDAWVGTVRMVKSWNMPEMGIYAESTWANVRFEVDSSYAPGDSTTWWKSVSGSLRWKMQMEGRCTLSGSGRMPIRTGADLNPLVTLQESPKGRFDNTIVLNASLGPWPDAYAPRVSFRCKDDGPIPPRPWLAYGLMSWWNHQLAGMKSEDGKTFKGSLIKRGAGQVTTWTWDFRMDP